MTFLPRSAWEKLSFSPIYIKHAELIDRYLKVNEMQGISRRAQPYGMPENQNHFIWKVWKLLVEVDVDICYNGIY